MARLTKACEAAKLELCEQNEVTVRLDVVEGHNLNIKLTRNEFEDMINEILEKVKIPVENALK